MALLSRGAFEELLGEESGDRIPALLMEIFARKSASKCSGLVGTGGKTQRIKNWFCGLRGGGGGLAGYEGKIRTPVPITSILMR